MVVLLHQQRKGEVNMKISDKEILLHLKHIQSIVCKAAHAGFNPQAGTWATEMFNTNCKTSDILTDRTGHYSGKGLEEE